MFFHSLTLLDFTAENLAQFDAAINFLKYQPLLPIKLESLVSEIERRRIINEKNLIAFSFYNSFSNAMSLNILIDVPLKFADMWNNKEIRKTEDIEISLVSIEDLIKLKQYANRKQDNDDILLLSKLVKK